MKFLTNVWHSIKRNPVINAFVLAITVQIFQDWQAGTIDVKHISGYLLMVFLSVGARMFTVPAKEVNRDRDSH